MTQVQDEAAAGAVGTEVSQAGVPAEVMPREGTEVLPVGAEVNWAGLRSTERAGRLLCRLLGWWLRLWGCLLGRRLAEGGSP